ncbi:MAG: DnaJ domain-containing protein [Sphingosinicella sp.]
MIVKLLIALALLAGLALLWRSLARRGDTMGVAEARALLGVGEQATTEEIRDAHRRLIARVHPDAGGSAELAHRVNAARDTLVADRNRIAS